MEMKRLTLLATTTLLLVFIAAASPASQHTRAQQDHDQASSSVQKKQPQVPFSAQQGAQTVLGETARSKKGSSVAEENGARAQQDGWSSPAVIVQAFIAVVGLGYLIFACLQWLAIKGQARQTNEAFVANKRAFMVPVSFNQYHERHPDGLYYWRFRPN